MKETKAIQSFDEAANWLLENAGARRISPKRADIAEDGLLITVVDCSLQVKPSAADVIIVTGSAAALSERAAWIAEWQAVPCQLPCAPVTLSSLVTSARALRMRPTARPEKRTISELINIGRSLAQVRDIDELLERILRTARDLTNADSGTVYVVEFEDNEPVRLSFRETQNDSIDGWGYDGTIEVSSESIVGHCVLTKRPLSISDLYGLAAPGEGNNPWGFSHDRSLDERNQYETHSLLTVPMISARNQVIGVIQLINCKRPGTLSLYDKNYDNVIPFPEAATEIAVALAGQAGIALENAMLHDEVQRLFDGFVSASVTAIESRDPTTSGHSERVATLTVNLAEVVDELAYGPYADTKFSVDEMRSLRYASLLHDFGKVGVREHVLVKAKKLYPHEHELIRLRFAHIREQLQRFALENDVPREQVEQQLRDIELYWQSIESANEPSVLDADVSANLERIAECVYDDEGCAAPYLREYELHSLKVKRGSLTPQERKEIESHVVHTYNFLKRIPWSRSLAEVPAIAGAHHEKLNGTGYPHGLSGPDIPIGARMMTISDIYDALTASDRPYKKALPQTRALDIIRAEAERGALDNDLVELFVSAKVFDR